MLVHCANKRFEPDTQSRGPNLVVLAGGSLAAWLGAAQPQRYTDLLNEKQNDYH